MKRLIRDEKGQAIVLALILLMIGGLVTAPLLAHMGTGLTTGEVYEKRTVELYAADAGVEDALWNIQHEVDEVMGLTGCYPDWSYEPADVNGKNLEVTITWVDNMTYRILSTATGDGSGTEIEAYVVAVSKYGDYAGILNNVLTSQGEIEIGPGSNITPSEGEHSPVEYYPGDWPPMEELMEFYLGQVAGVDPYDSDTLDIDGVDTEIGPLYREGELYIKNTSNDEATLTLTGTVYVTGDTLIGSTGKDFNLDLNGHTIFIASDSADPQKALWIGGKCSIEGYGIIIAIGDVYFEPNIAAGVADPIFIMSVEGTTTLNPGGDFYGSIAGSVEVDLQPNSSLNYPDEEEWFGDLNFLIGVQQLIYHLDSWEVTPL